MTKTSVTPLRGPALHAYRIRAAQIALFAACKRAIELGYTPLLPVAEAQAPYDLMMTKNGTREAPLRVQVKHRKDGTLPPRSPSSGRRASQRDFDYYALYVPSVDKVIFVPVSMAGATIAVQMPNSATPFYWWADFDAGPSERIPPKRRTSDFGVKITYPSRRGRSTRPERGQWPTDEELLALIEEHSMSSLARDIGVSVTAVRKRLARLGARGHPPGYWARRYAGRQGA